MIKLVGLRQVGWSKFFKLKPSESLHLTLLFPFFLFGFAIVRTIGTGFKVAERAEWRAGRLLSESSPERKVPGTMSEPAPRCPVFRVDRDRT
jgi:hypothetical protein